MPNQKGARQPDEGTSDQPTRRPAVPDPKPQVPRPTAAHLISSDQGDTPGHFSNDATVHTFVDTWIAERREALHQQARAREIETMGRLIERRREHKHSGSARLAVRVRDPRRPGGTPTIEWVQARGRGRSDYIPRGRGEDAYPPAILRAAAKAWEWDIVQSAERDFARIRRGLRLLRELRAYWRKALDELAALESESA